jgi:hypothetical protein
LLIFKGFYFFANGFSEIKAEKSLIFRKIARVISIWFFAPFQELVMEGSLNPPTRAA